MKTALSFQHERHFNPLVLLVFRVPFEFLRRQIAGGRMAARSVVVAIDLIERFGPSFFGRNKSAARDEFRFERRKEVLGLSIVVAISFARHRLPQPCQAD